jgi:F-type H+-transporting ATPase subunit b
MDIAVTLIIQGLAFFVVVLVVMRYLWPPLMAAIEERQRKIAEGLAAGSKAQKDLDDAKVKAQEIIREARDKAVQIVDQASKRAADTTRAREGLRKQVARLAVQGASHLLEREIDPKTHADLLGKLELEVANG